MQLMMALAILGLQIATTYIADAYISRRKELNRKYDVYISNGEAADIAGTGIWVGVIVSRSFT